MDYSEIRPFANNPETELPEELKRLHQVASRLQAENVVPLPADFKDQLTMAYAYGETKNFERKQTQNLDNAVFIINAENDQKFVMKIYGGNTQETRFINETGTLRFLHELHSELVTTPEVKFANPNPSEDPFIIMEYLQGEPLQIQNDENLDTFTPDLELLLKYFVGINQGDSSYVFFSNGASENYQNYFKATRSHLNEFREYAKDHPQLQKIDINLLNSLQSEVERLNQEKISSKATFQKGDDHPENFLKSADGRLIGLDAEKGGIYPAHLNFAEFVWHEKTHLPIKVRQEMVDRYVVDAKLNSQEITQLNHMLEASWLKWIAITARMSLPGNIARHPLRSTIPLTNELVWGKIVDELNTRLSLGPKAIQVTSNT